MLGSENNLTHEYYSANRNLRALYTDLYNMTNPFSDMLVPSVSCPRLTRRGKDEVLCSNAFEIKVKCKIKGFFHLLNVFRCFFLQSAWLDRARLHLDLLLRLWRFCFLVADVWPNRHQWTAAVDRVEEVPRFFGDLPRVSACRVQTQLIIHRGSSRLVPTKMFYHF